MQAPLPVLKKGKDPQLLLSNAYVFYKLRDPDLQQILKEIKQRRDNGEAVLVRLQPEPYDSRAILFQAFQQP